MNTKLDEFYAMKWGIFTHFLGGNDAEEWNRRVDSVNVDSWAEQIANTGAGFFGVTLMQVNRCMLAPNNTYDLITGYKPGEACARRDFVMDMSDALSKRNVALMLYFTGDGPCRDSSNIANRAFGFTSPKLIDGRWAGEYEPSETVDNTFIDKWSSVLAEYAQRYGDRVFAWWIDGCYDGGCYDGSWYTPKYYAGDRDGKLLKYKRAVRAGNPEALIAFNGGVMSRVRRYSSLDDYTAGEMSELFDEPDSRFTDGAQWFEFLCNGFWYEGNRSENAMRFTADDMLAYVQRVREKGGIVMFDTRFIRDETMDRAQLAALSKLRNIL